MNLDFSPFNNSSQYQEDKTKLHTSGKRFSLHLLLIILGIFIPLAWPFLIYYTYAYYKNNKQKMSERLRMVHEFAKLNGFEFTEYHKGFVSQTSEKITVQLPFGTEEAMPWYELKGSINGRKFSYSMASVYFKNNRDQDSIGVTHSIFSMELPVSVPKLLINSKYNNLVGMEMKANRFEVAEQHSLEGDFYKFYEVIAEKNEHIDMYTVLTPEVMDALKRHDLYDVWLSGNHMTIITTADMVRYFAAVPDVFTTASVLMQEIDVIARAMRAKSRNP